MDLKAQHLQEPYTMGEFTPSQLTIGPESAGPDWRSSRLVANERLAPLRGRCSRGVRLPVRDPEGCSAIDLAEQTRESMPERVSGDAHSHVNIG
ncbi:hypothetical protein GCM10010317_100700 [Streptomyces mirabilis]|nr:hypothetical protein GCM10010317_100700 [Streptomyces mirabilis]